MGAIKIDCYLTETKMSNIVQHITNHLYNVTPAEIEDIDDTIEGVRLCVDFDVFLETTKIKAAEILCDKEWDVLDEDTAVLNSKLKTVIRDYNQHSKDAYRQALGIRETELANNY